MFKIVEWRAARDKSGHFYDIEIKGPFPWSNRRSTSLSPQRKLAEELLQRSLKEKHKADLPELRAKICLEVQQATGVSRKQAYNAVDKAFRMHGFI